MACDYAVVSSAEDKLDDHYFGSTLEERARDKPLSILQLNPADRAVLRIADERDAIQKKTFTKWVNKHLRKIERHVDDLFEDLRDGHYLVSLLEVLSGDHLPRERGRMRIHMLQNVQTTLDYLRYRKIKLVNIRAEDIVDSNPKLTLGLIWTIILHFQISDIMVGQDESLTAREALLRWAKRTTDKYPGVLVRDFTNSWKDGLAFNAIIHRNRPDLVDWRSLKNGGIHDRLDSAFDVMEREYGVTRLIDPEDVNTPELDEKSLITYISSLYDVFPNPPSLHPLYDPDMQNKYTKYRELSSSLHNWIRENMAVVQFRNFPNTLVEVEKLAHESNRFLAEEVPQRQREKQQIIRIFKEVERFLEETEEKVEPELRPDVLERSWNQFMALHQERDAAIHKEIERLERLEQIAEKVHREAKATDTRLDEIELRFEGEAKRLNRLHPRDAEQNCDALNADLATVEEAIKIMFSDVELLKDGRYTQTGDLLKRVERIHQRWMSIRTLFQSRQLDVHLGLLPTPLENEQFESAAGLLKLTNNQSEKMSDIGSKQKDFQDAATKAKAWLKEVEPKVAKIINETLCAEPKTMEDQLTRAKALNNDVLKNERLVSRTMQAATSLLATLQEEVTEVERNKLESVPAEMQERYLKLRNALADKCKLLNNALQSQGVQEALDSLANWLSQAENQLKNIMRPASLNKDRLDEQVREHRALVADIESHRPSFEGVNDAAATVIANPDNARVACKIENKKKDLNTRYEKLYENVFERRQALGKVSILLDTFLGAVINFDEWYQQVVEILDSADNLETEQLGTRIEDIARQRDLRKDDFEAMLQNGKNLLVKKDIADAIPIREKITSLELQWKVLTAVIDQSMKDGKTRLDHLHNYEKLRDQVLEWLTRSENRVDSMEPVAVDIEILRKQTEEFVPIMKEYRDYRATISRVAALGTACESLSRPDTRKPNPSQEERPSITSYSSAVQQQTEDIYHRYSLLGSKLQDRQSELDIMLEETNRHADSLKSLAAFLDKIERQLPLDSTVPLNRDDAEKQLRILKNVLEDVHDKHPLLNGLQIQIAELVRRKSGVPGADVIQDQLVAMCNRWKDRLERCKVHCKFLEDSKDFHDTHDQLTAWLIAKDRMVSVLGPIASDPRLVLKQLQQVQVLREEYKANEPRFQHMERLADSILKIVRPSFSDGRKVLLDMGQNIANRTDSQERAEIQDQLQELVVRFNNLTTGANDRMNALLKAMAVAKKFHDEFSPIAEWLEEMERKIKEMDIVPTDEGKIQQRIEEHYLLHGNILSKKPAFDNLADVATNLMSLVGEEEADVLADRLTEVTDRYGALIENSETVGCLLSDVKCGLRHFVLSYEHLLDWMDDMESRLSKYRILSVHVEKLHEQTEELMHLTKEVVGHEHQVDSVVDTGVELIRHITNEEALHLNEKLDSFQRRYTDLTGRADDLLRHAQETLPLVEQFRQSHGRLSDWLLDAEARVHPLEYSSATGGSAGLGIQESILDRLQTALTECRPLSDMVNEIGPQLCQRCPGEGAAFIETLITRDNRRFDTICEQIHRKAERLYLSKQQSMGVVCDLDELLDWFRETESHLEEAEPPISDPEVIRVQLKEHKILGEEISTLKGRVRDILSAAKKVLREAAQNEDAGLIREKMEDLKETTDHVSKLSADRLSILEQALPLAEHFFEAHADLSQWLDEMETELFELDAPAIRAEQIVRQQENNKLLLADVTEHKLLFGKLNKTGTTLAKLCTEEEGAKVQEILESDNSRYVALRVVLRERQQALEEAFQETSQFSDKLDGMLAALVSTFDQVKLAEPVSAHPDKIHELIQENQAVVEDLKKRESAFDAVKRAADEVIRKASNLSDPAIKDIKGKLERLSSLWDTVVSATGERGKSLEDALAVAEKFWDELQAVMAALKELQDTLVCQEPPAVEPAKIQQQQSTLHDIKHEIDQTKPEVEQCRRVGQKLISLCGDPDKPEVKKHIEELDSAWDNITALYAKREENLIDAMEKAMEFHDTLKGLLEFLEKVENKFHNLRPIGSDIETVKEQIEQLKAFKSEVDPQMVKVEALNRQANELTERTSPDQDARLKEPLNKVNRRWEDLLRGLVERQRELEHALLRLGQFQHALNELLVWIQRTDSTLDELKPVFGDPSVIEVELAKLKVLINDIQAHQTSVDTLNDAGRQLVESDKGSDDANKTQQRLVLLNKKWSDLVDKASNRQKELEDAHREAQAFTADTQDLLLWLNDIDGALSISKPVGGLPETATEQLQRFMEVYNDLEQKRPQVETTLQRGAEYLKRSTDGAASSLSQNLRTLKQRWDNVMNRANDKRIKLEIALKETNEFHQVFQAFVDWLTNAEKILGGLKPASRVMETVLAQIEEHKSFQKDIGAQREVMLSLDKKGTHLKYFSQKQDVILIKNLLISVQHRWERVLPRAAERTRALDHAYKEAKEFHDSWHELYSWLDEAEKNFDESVIQFGKDPEKIKQLLAKHKEFQRTVAAKQPKYDAVMRVGKLVKDRAPKTDEPVLRQMMSDVNVKWLSVCNKSVDRQRKLEEGLLLSGQFKDAIQALVDWLCQANLAQMVDGPVHGDLDTMKALRDQHKSFEEELNGRLAQTKQVRKTAMDLMATASEEDKAAIQQQVSELDANRDQVMKASKTRSARLDDALAQAEALYKAVNMLLEWLSDAEMKLRFAGALPDEEPETVQQLTEHHKFLEEMARKEGDKDKTITLAQEILAKAHPDAVAVIRHWITIIQSRWEEVMALANQREHRLNEHLSNLHEMGSLLEELLAWLAIAEKTLVPLKAEAIPDDLPVVEGLIKEHQEFMEDLNKRTPEVDRVCKTKQLSRAGAPKERKPSRNKSVSSKVSVEVQPRNPRARLLCDKWRNVWMMAWERQRRLQEKLTYLQELEKVKNFSWDDWRRRFMKFMNHKKSRVTDLFRKMDKNNDGFVPREDFIDGIMKTKFSTSRMEMNAVANMFDRNGEGYIDGKEFLAALRPDWEEKPTTEDEIIHDEVQRQVQQCTCRNRFKVHQVGEGQYRFGDIQKLRLFRILRSTVMVRVGGGWVALDEFLVKNDPCRAKGRTNLEIREQFFLPDGVFQGMSPFKTMAASPNNSISGPPGTDQIVTLFHAPSPSLPTAGPITKVREKTTARSSPMRAAFSAGTPDSSISEGDGSFHMHGRKGCDPPRVPSGSISGLGSRPASRNADSKHGSMQSLDSCDGGTGPKTPVSVRCTPSFQLPDSSAPRNRPGSSSALPQKGSATTSDSSHETRVRHPSGSSKSGMSPSPSAGGLNGSSASRSRPSIAFGQRTSVATSRPVFRTPSTSNIPVSKTPTQRGRSASGSSGSGLPGSTPTLRREGTSDSMTGTSTFRKPSASPSTTPFRPSPK